MTTGGLTLHLRIELTTIENDTEPVATKQPTTLPLKSEKYNMIMPRKLFTV